MRANYFKSLVLLGVFSASAASAQTLINQGGYSSTSLVDTNSTSNSVSNVTTNNTSTSTSTNTNLSTVNSTSVNTNNNVNSGTVTYNNNNVQSGTLTNINQNTTNGTMTYNNNNVNSGTMTYNNVQSGTLTNINQNTSTSASTNVNTNNNINSGTMTYNNNNATTSSNTNVNQNNNVSTSNATNVNQNVNTGDMTNRNINDTNITQKIVQPPPTAIAPAMMSMGSDLCVTGVSGATQTQIFGLSFGGTMRDANCERLKISKTLFDMGMKVAAVATMCQDRRVFDAMMAAGTPCPFEGKIGEQAKVAWEANPGKIPTIGKEYTNKEQKQEE